MDRAERALKSLRLDPVRSDLSVDNRSERPELEPLLAMSSQFGDPDRASAVRACIGEDTTGWMVGILPLGFRLVGKCTTL